MSQRRTANIASSRLIEATIKLADQIIAMLHEPRGNLDNPVVNAITIGAPTHVFIRKRFILISELFEYGKIHEIEKQVGWV